MATTTTITAAAAATVVEVAMVAVGGAGEGQCSTRSPLGPSGSSGGRGFHSSTSHLTEPEPFLSLKLFIYPAYPTKSAHLKPEVGRVSAPERWPRTTTTAAVFNPKQRADAALAAGDGDADSDDTETEQARLLKSVAQRLADTLDNLPAPQATTQANTEANIQATAATSAASPSGSHGPGSPLAEAEARLHAASIVIQSAYRGHAARRDVCAGILRPTRGAGTSPSHSGRRISFAERIDDSGGSGSGGGGGSGKGGGKGDGGR